MERLLRTEEVAEILCVAPMTIRTWVFKRRIPFVKLGKSVRFRREDIEKIRLKGLPTEG